MLCRLDNYFCLGIWTGEESPSTPSFLWREW